jgi:hypothetical protein
MADELTVRFHRQQRQRNAALLAALRIMWREFTGDPTTFPRFALPAAALIERQARDAGDAGIAYYRALRVKMLGHAPQQTLPPPPPLEEIETSLGACGLAGTYIAIGQGMTTEQARAHAFVRVARAATRHVANGARFAVAVAAAEDNAAYGYRRRTTGTCDFCEGLAAEGLHPSEEFPAHDGCQCAAEPAFRMTMDQIDTWATERFSDDLTDDMANVVRGYTSDGDFLLYNNALRAGKELTGGILGDSFVLDEAITTSQVPENLTVFRGISRETLPKDWVADAVITDPGYVSTTLNVDMSTEFAEQGWGWTMDIDVPAGVNGLYITEDLYEASATYGKQNEILFGRGTRFRIKGINEDTHHLTLEMLP